MKNKRKAAISESVVKGIREQEVVQKKPNTCVVLRVIVGDKEYIGEGFSKARWPDKWDSSHGVALARKKAIADVVRKIMREEKESVTRFSSE